MNQQSAQDSISPEYQQLPPVRSELKAYHQIYDGQPYWVLKDPLSLRYYRFNREEYFIICELQKGVTLDELKAAHRGEFHTDCLNNAEIAQFVRTLRAKNLIVMEQPDRDELLYQSSKKLRRKKITSQFTNFLFFKIPVFDPDKWLDRIYPRIRFLWTWPFFAVYMTLLIVGLLMVINRWHDFSDMFRNQFLTLYNVPILIASIWIVKALHEFGHGLTCKNYGGEVHEMGWLFLVFMPFFYCNVTDSWTFPNKRHRILVTAGGIMTELFFAGVAAIVWFLTEPPGFMHTFSFYFCVTCSLSTVLFNANPLLRFDGYYMLMDMIEVPNLRQRSSKFMNILFVRYVLGGRPDEMPEEHRFRSVFPIYSVAALIYRWFIVFAILFTVYGMFKRLHLVFVGQFLFVFSVATMLLLPLSKQGVTIVRQRESLGISNTRLLAILAGIVVLVGVALFWPMHQHVTLNFILEPPQVQWIRSQVDGHLQWSDSLREGVHIESVAAAPVVVGDLTNKELEWELERIAGEIDKAKVEFAYYKKMGSGSQAKRLRDRVETLVREQERIRTMVDQLSVEAPFSGEVLSRREEIEMCRERYLPRGTPLLLLAETSELAAKVWVSEKTLARIFRQSDQAGQPAELMLYAFSGDEFTGRVAGRPGSHREESMGEFGEKLALSNKVGGEVLTEFDHVTEQERPIEPVYEVTILLDKETVPPSARPYMSGRVRIDCGKSTLLQWGRESLLRFISPEARL